MSNYRIFYHPDTISTTHSFDTTRKGADVAEALASQGWLISTPTPLSVAEATQTHSADYVNAIVHGTPRDLAKSQGFPWDAQMWRSVAAQNGALRDAVLSAITGIPAYAVSAGFHHARSNHGAGFCTLNGLAIGADIALKNGVRKVFILDVDAHCGGGTYSMVHDYAHIVHLDLSVHHYDQYPPASPHQLLFVNHASDYLTRLQHLLSYAEVDLQAGDLVIYNAGMDPYEGCDLGGMPGIDGVLLQQREALVTAWIRRHQLNVAACLAGGYNGADFSHQELIAMHVMSVTTLLHQGA
jgi:acetoin utilization deacetylase AcuC-like enzyme